MVLTADIQTSRAFYETILGLCVEEVSDDFVLFEGGFALHDRATIETRLGGDLARGTNSLFYFEVDELDAFWAAQGDLDVIHPPRREAWGGYVARLRDPDGHIIEIGEATTG